VTQCWRARLTFAGKHIHLGSFNTQLEAAKQIDRCVQAAQFPYFNSTCIFQDARACAPRTSPPLPSAALPDISRRLLSSLRPRSCLYKRDGRTTGPHCGPLSEAEQAEIDGMTLEEIRKKWTRVDVRSKEKTSTYRGVIGVKDVTAPLRWKMQFRDKKKTYQKLFATEEEAARAYDKCAHSQLSSLMPSREASPTLADTLLRAGRRSACTAPRRAPTRIRSSQSKPRCSLPSACRNRPS